MRKEDSSAIHIEIKQQISSTVFWYKTGEKGRKVRGGAYKEIPRFSPSPCALHLPHFTLLIKARILHKEEEPVMKNHSIKLCVVITALLCISGLSAGAGEDRPDTLFRHPDGFYSIEIPAGWSRSQGIMNIWEFKEPKKGSEGTFQKNIKIVAARMASGMTLDSYIDSSVLAWKDIWKVLKKEDVIVSGNKAKLLTIDQTVPGLKTRIAKYFVEKDGFIYIISCSAEEKDFEATLPLFRKTVGTFTISKK